MSAHIPFEIRERVREAFQERCAYCQTAERITVVTFEVEHIIPVSKGGMTEFENLCLACPMCNRHKASRTEHIDPATDESVPLFHPRRDRWLDHFTWNVEGSELVGLSSSGRATIAALRINRPQLIRTRKLWIAVGEHPP